MSASTRGRQRERQVKALLEEDGWLVVKAGGSFGVADLVALKSGNRSRLLEVKSTAAGPFEHFGPKDRAELLAAAKQAGATAELVWWPPRKQPKFLRHPSWP